MQKDFSSHEEFIEFISKRVAHLRSLKDVSARSMSLDIGQNESYINGIENKKKMPSISGLFYICEYLGVQLKDFFDTGNEMPEVLEEVVSDLKILDRKSLEQVSVVIKKFAGK